jgi:hemoglobin/transferrin/lactoferrin receptor protein
MNRIFFAFMALLSCALNAQQVTVRDKTSLERLPGVTIYSKLPPRAATTDAAGHADVSKFTGADSIFFSLLGYKPVAISYARLEANGFRVALEEAPYFFDEVVVSASRFEEKKEDVAQQVQVLKARELQFMNQSTSADVLQQSGNVLVQKSQLGGGSPIIRGFETNKVLIVVDGVRMNNAIYRGGHLQNVLTLDNAIMDKMEIVFGPGSVVYGSDAIGGVMHFFTRNPVLADTVKSPVVKAGAFTRYGSASGEKSGHIDFNMGWKKFAFLTSVTYSDFDDLRQGAVRNPFYGSWGRRPWYVEPVNGRDSIMRNSDENVQRQSGYSQYDVLGKALFRPRPGVDHVLNVQYSNSSNVPFYSRLTQVSGGKPRYAEWYYGPQQRLFASYALSIDKGGAWYDHARFIAAVQDLRESRHDRGFNSVFRNSRREQVGVYTFNADLERRVRRHELRYGAEATYNLVSSKAFSDDIASGNRTPLDTRYPDGGSEMFTGAVYFSHSYELTPRFVINDGIRYSHVSLHSAFNDTTFFPFPFREITQDNDAVSGNIGLVYMPGREWRFAVLASSGFRAPNVDDLSKVFESVPGNVVVPNPGLKPEYAYNGEMTISKGFSRKVVLECTGFYTVLDNAIVTKPAQFRGADSLYFDGQMSRVTSSQNAGEAFVTGLSGALKAAATDNFSIHSTLNYTYGRIRTDSVPYPLDHIPPVFGRTGFVLKLKRLQGEFFVMYNGWKRVNDYNIFGEDNFAQATPHGTPAWVTLNARASYNFTSHVQLQLAVENIADVNYRVFASGISAPGRNVVVTVRGKF